MWRAFGDLRDAQYAIDGNLSTAAVSASSYDNARFTLDLGKEEWRFYTDGGTAGKEALKAGDKVTVTYKQIATKIEGKGGAKAPAKKK